MFRHGRDPRAERERDRWIEEQLDIQADDPPQDDSPILYGTMGFLVIVIPLFFAAALGLIIYHIHEQFGLLGIFWFFVAVAVAISAWNGLVWLGKYVVDRYF